MFGGDEVGAVVLDMGSSNIRAGYAGEDTPVALFPTETGLLRAQYNKTSSIRDGTPGLATMDIEPPTPSQILLSPSPSSSSSSTTSSTSSATPKVEQAFKDNEAKNIYYCGHHAWYRRDHMEIVNPIKHGLVNDWDAVEKLWDYVFKQHMHINLDEHPLLLAEPSFAPHSQRSKMIELAFEKYDVPATFLCKDAVLSAFAAGKSTAMVVDVGGGKTTVTPVHEGFILQRGLQKSNVGGIMLDRVLEQVMFESKNQSVPPRYLYKRRAVPAPMDGVVGDGVGELDGEYRTSYTTTKLSFPNTSASYHQFMCNRVIQDLKHGACRVADTRSMFEHAMATTTTGTGLSAVSTVPTTDYDLPDGTVLEVGPERMKIAEELFSPTDLLLKQQTNTIVNGIVNDDLVKGFAFNGLPKMIAAAGERVDVDIKKELFNFIILSGGCSLMHGFQNRLSKSIDVPAAFKVKVINALQNERKYAAWTGGSILASLGTFHQMWFSRSEYEEHGASILQRKCP